MRGLRNFYAEEPYQHSIYYTNNLMAEIQWTKAELLQSAAGQSQRGPSQKSISFFLKDFNERTMLNR